MSFQSINLFLSARAVPRLAVMILCLNLLLPLAWQSECNAFFGMEVLAQSETPRPVFGRKMMVGQLPATLSEAPSVAPRAGLGRSTPRPVSSDASKQMMAIYAASRLPALRIDPLVGDVVVTPSFLLPSEHGLISFAIPPPAVS